MPAWKGKLWRGVIIHFPSAIPCITIAVTELHHGMITVGLLPLPSSKVNYRFIMLYSFLYATPSLPCFFPDGVEQPSESSFCFPSMRRSNWNPYKWNPFGWGSGGFSSFQFRRNNNHCVIIFMLLLCRAVRQAEIPHNMWRTEPWSRRRWSHGDHFGPTSCL